MILNGNNSGITHNSKIVTAPNVGKDGKKQELSFIVEGTGKWFGTWEGSLAVSYKAKDRLTI